VEAIVLAGGLGTRLKSVVTDVPKPMAPIDSTPFLEYILRYLKKNGITRVVLSVGYKWEIIKEYFGNNFEDIEIIYSVEDKPLGTGGAINKAIDYVIDKQIFIINGDTFFDIDLSKMKLENDSKIQIALKEMKDFDRYGVVEIDINGYIQNFKEKSYYKQGLINGGIYLIKKNIFEKFDLPKKFSFEEFLENNFQKLKAKGRVFEDYFIDIGIPEDYEKAKRYFSENFIFG